jgi:hypothetical protein
MTAPVTDERLVKHVFWPDPCPYDAAGIRLLFRHVRRYVDLDGTIATRAGRFVRPSLRGKTVAEFLAEEPFIVQTWNPEGAIMFFAERYPEYPKPILIIFPPGFPFINAEGREDIGKDFAALGITGATIIDDWPPSDFNAPGCAILPP